MTAASASLATASAPSATVTMVLNAKGSLFLTRPGLGAHATDDGEHRQRAEAVLRAVTDGVIKPATWRVYPLSEAAEAYAALENGQSAGAILLKP